VTLADMTVSELLEQLAARTPSPAGGAAAALAGAAAAALTEMAAAFALARAAEEEGSMAAVHGRAGALRAQLLGLADADMVAYQPVLDALAMSRADQQRASALSAALSSAAEVPLEILAASTEVAELAAEIMLAPGNRLLSGDVSTALALADAACRAAARLVEMNLDATPDDPRLRQATLLADRAAELQPAALARRPTSTR
jgi:formiminotetrahydrofolate cyclodeaminase